MTITTNWVIKHSVMDGCLESLKLDDVSTGRHELRSQNLAILTIWPRLMTLHVWARIGLKRLKTFPQYSLVLNYSNEKVHRWCQETHTSCRTMQVAINELFRIKQINVKIVTNFPYHFSPLESFRILLFVCIVASSNFVTYIMIIKLIISKKA
jgi:hypothetical protein